MSLPGRFLNLGGHRVFYHRRGRGTPVLLVHGFLVSHYAWRAVIAELAAAHDVIAIDLPGFGESDRPRPVDFRYDFLGYMETLVGVLDSLEIPRAALVGHSMGGGIALVTAARRPERVSRLAVVNPLVYPFKMPPEILPLLVPGLGPMLFRALYTRGIMRRSMLKDIYCDPALVTEEWVDYIWERVNRPGGLEAAHAVIRACANPRVVEDSLRLVRCPTLVAWGDGDRLFAAASAERLRDDIAGSELHLIPGCGHAPHEEQPAALVRQLAPFLTADGEARARPAVAAVST
jgi:pimeloyl-ACP methyl ester carboxylesterase